MELAASYGDAEKILDKASRENLNIHAVWAKLYRITRYLRGQSEAELKEVLS
jgi:hypothetical protein